MSGSARQDRGDGSDAAEREQTRKRAASLQQTRAQALEMINGAASSAEQQQVAGNLATDMLALVNDEGLWRRLASGRATAEEQATRFAPLIMIDFSLLLDQLGHELPPPAFLLSDGLNRAMADAVSGRPGADVNGARDQARLVAVELRSLLAAPPRDPGPLQRALRHGVRSAGHLLVPAMLSVFDLAAVSAGPVLGWHVDPATAVGATAVAFGSGFLKGVDERVQAGADRWFGEVEVSHGWKDEPDREAADAFVEHFRAGSIGLLVSKTKSFDAGPLSPGVHAELRSGLETWVSGLYLTWDAAIGAPWADAEFVAHCQALTDSLAKLRAATLDGTSSGASVARLLQRVSAEMAELTEVLAVRIDLHPQLQPGVDRGFGMT